MFQIQKILRNSIYKYFFDIFKCEMGHKGPKGRRSKSWTHLLSRLGLGMQCDQF